MLFALRKWYVVALLTLCSFGFAAVVWPVEDVMAPPAVMASDEDPPGWELADLDEAEMLVPVSETYRPERVGFALQVGEALSPHRIMSLFLMPGETTELRTVDLTPERELVLEASAGTAVPLAPGAWRYTAPSEPGRYVVRIGGGGEGMLVNVFVKVPYDGGETLGDYRIGRYETRPYRNNPMFTRPEGFIEVTPDLLAVRLTPHFTLGQFLCKQESGWPKYTLVDERLLLKLELLLERVNARGFDAPTFFVMSSFRTPFYNAAIGNRTTYSVHLYGGAADIFIDRDGDAHMDDLDGDGAATTEEARAMAAVVDDLKDEAVYQPFVGGLGLYSPASHRGPFIHVDVRGEDVRW